MSLPEYIIDRSMEIVRDFKAWDETTGPCPITLTDRYWFQKLCAMAETQAILEARLGLIEDPDAETQEDAEKRQREWVLWELITFGPALMFLVIFGAIGILQASFWMPRILSDGWVAGGMLIGTFGWMFPFIMYRAHLADKKREKRI